jgi:hypothetical protein
MGGKLSMIIQTLAFDRHFLKSELCHFINSAQDSSHPILRTSTLDIQVVSQNFFTWFANSAHTDETSDSSI